MVWSGCLTATSAAPSLRPSADGGQQEVTSHQVSSNCRPGRGPTARPCDNGGRVDDCWAMASSALARASSLYHVASSDSKKRWMPSESTAATVDRSPQLRQRIGVGGGGG
ncbi:unnamed protein product [Urochloa humidicola]